MAERHSNSSSTTTARRGDASKRGSRDAGVLCIIPARSGSRGLRHKNVRRLGGVPLLQRAIALARASRRARERWHIICSTDSPHYARLARAAGADVHGLRPARLATHNARLIDVVTHAIQTARAAGCRFDTVLLLSCTTPLTRPHDVRAALRLFWRHGGTNEPAQAPSVAAVVATGDHASWRFGLRGRNTLVGAARKVVRRQQGAPEVQLNGAIYVATPQWLRRHGQFVVAHRTRAYVMPKSRSIDIDDAVDLALCELLLKQQ